MSPGPRMNWLKQRLEAVKSVRRLLQESKRAEEAERERERMEKNDGTGILKADCREPI